MTNPFAVKSINYFFLFLINLYINTSSGSTAGLSKHFKKRGVPALLVYKNGQVIGNFINVSDTLGTDFYASDVESFLLENGIIVDKNCVPKIIANSNDDGSE